MSLSPILPGSGVSIVPATWRDLMDLHELEKICFQRDAWPLLDVMGVLTFPQVIRLKAVAGTDLAGFIAVDLRRGQRAAWIATLAVDPGYRKQGIGSGLIIASEEQIDLPVMRLSVRESNFPAIELYRKHGFQQVEIWKSYYRGGVDALVFEKVMKRPA